jgi:hypothetical protein
VKTTLSLDQLRALHARVKMLYGKEVGVIGEDTQTKGKYRGFSRWARFDKHDGPIQVLVLLRSDDSIGGFFVQPVEKPAGKPGEKPAEKRPS